MKPRVEIEKPVIETDCSEGKWYFSKRHCCTGKAIEVSRLWENVRVCLWLPDSDSVVRLSSSDLIHIGHQSSTISSEHLVYVAAGARVADALTQDVLFAPIEASVIPLPHQIRALSRAIGNERVRFLLADEVGLGKTIEAGLIMRELKLRKFKAHPGRRSFEGIA